jgi:hypothetical protein
MAAKPAKKNARASAAVAATPAAPVPAAVGPAAESPAPAAPAAGTFTAWIDSTDPRKRALGKAVLVGVWLYVGALWLLALDQTFDWGIFGPRIPPLP